MSEVINMRITEWAKKVRSSGTGVYSGVIADEVKVTKLAEGARWRIAQRKTCDMGHEHSKELLVQFKEEVGALTTFEVGCLFQLFMENKKPTDYAGFHTSPAGREFIKKIKTLHKFDR